LKYPSTSNLQQRVRRLGLEARAKHEEGASGLGRLIRRAERDLEAVLRAVERARGDARLARCEPKSLEAIRAQRPAGPRRLWPALPAREYARKVEGALLARMAGCTLGAIVEGWPVERMEAWAKEIGDSFPPVDYWSRAKEPDRKRYGVSPCSAYTRRGLNGVPVDDDVVYTVLGLLIAEAYGPHFTTEDVARAWLRWLPLACTAEEVALRNLRAGIPASRAAEKDNPFRQWIGAAIRADPWAYVAPGWPEKAAEMAYRDAYLSHRRNGIYGAMFFAAAISAAFAVTDVRAALEIGLSEIPARCRLARDVRWALRVGGSVTSFREGRRRVDQRFAGMSVVHTNNNACLTVFGLLLGGRDVTRVLSETVAMGMDNDCTAATAGSLVGALVGRDEVPPHWYRSFNNRVRTYLKGRPWFSIRGLVRRFVRQARRTLR